MAEADQQVGGLLVGDTGADTTGHGQVLAEDVLEVGEDVVDRRPAPVDALRG